MKGFTDPAEILKIKVLDRGLHFRGNVLGGAKLEKHDLKKAKSYPDDVLGSRPESSLDKIISNPPFHAGRQVDYQMAHALIAQSFRALKLGGSITLVANRFIRYDREMERFFSNVNCIFANPRYHVLRAIK